jgi:hypothetical protein
MGRRNIDDIAIRWRLDVLDRTSVGQDIFLFFQTGPDTHQASPNATDTWPWPNKKTQRGS